ncbi:MAG: SH3 domain-containing protein [Proteobacteria bacterium]|nr:SH3 domain-containing protein [Pseudomonadota bacterium]MBU1582789.1 SH3 domain-containing protein [Pseudomonadota bacterium]MBU2454370.1 SH3 domain-containing protein [Pseudomonadota bacterium]MBU2631500.1 SH3 domain-containing protein [Pseudomonadota bacterium]
MKRINIIIVVKSIAAIMAVLLILPGLIFAQERLCVKDGIANMRSGPGTNHDVLWQVEQYHPFTIVEKKGNWYKVKDFENDVAWIHNSLLGSIESVITKKDKCIVRSEPTKDGSKLFTAEKGVPFKVLGRKGNWIKIEHADSDIGWIYKTLVW